MTDGKATAGFTDSRVADGLEIRTPARPVHPPTPWDGQIRDAEKAVEVAKANTEKCKQDSRMAWNEAREQETKARAALNKLRQTRDRFRAMRTS